MLDFLCYHALREVPCTCFCGAVAYGSALAAHEMSEKKYFQVFIPSYSTDFPFIKRSRKGERYAFCSLCCCDVNISHAGRRDILLHVNTKKHKDSAKLVDSNGKLGGYFSKADLDTTTRAECLFYCVPD